MIQEKFLKKPRKIKIAKSQTISDVKYSNIPNNHINLEENKIPSRSVSFNENLIVDLNNNYNKNINSEKYYSKSESSTPSLFDQKRKKYKKLCWFIFVAISTSLCIYMIISTVLDYRAYEVITKIRVFTEKVIYFYLLQAYFIILKNILSTL